jgi:DNA invertase Pin-like site-specific DNA recombinase
MKAAIYARVSTLDQNPDLQPRELKAYAERSNYTVTETYLERGVSGAKVARPALDKLLRDARSGKFQVLLLWKLSRLGRSAFHLLSLLEDFRMARIKVISQTEGIDFDSPTGKLVYTILGAVAEMERETIRENVKAGLEAARARGVRIGRPSVTVDAQKLANLRQAGASWREIERDTGIHPSTARRAVHGLAKTLP